MIRTQVYLTKEIYHQVRIVAKADRKPAAQVIRELLEEGLELKQNGRPVQNGLLELAKIRARGGPRDLSENLDHYLYDED